MPSLTSLPIECLLLIFQSCDTISQAVTLSSTCKLIHSVYSSNFYSVLSRVGPRDIPAFNEALIAVRATRIVVNHFQQGQLPPNPFPLDSLSAHTQNPCPDDIRQVLDWQHLIRCIEDIYLHNIEWGQECRWEIKKAGSENTPPREWFTWRDNFHRSMYQSFLMGAVLCRAYQDPLSPSNRDGLPSHFLEHCDQRLKDRELPFLKSEEMAYLLKYPVFNFEAYDDHDPVYKQLADFLKQQAGQRSPCESALLDMYPEDAIPHDIDRSTAKVFYAEMVQCLLSSMTLLNHAGDSQIFREDDEHSKVFSRKVTVVCLGSFYPENILLPANPQDAHQTLPLKEPLPHKTEDSSWHPSSRFMEQVLYVMHTSSGQPNHYGDETWTPPPPLQVFQYIFRTFLGLRFSDDAYEEEYIDATHKMFVHYPEMCRIYLDGWPEQVPTLFDFTPGEEGEYEAYYA